MRLLLPLLKPCAIGRGVVTLPGVSVGWLCAVAIVHAVVLPSSCLAADATPFGHLISVRRAIAAGHVVLSIDGRQLIFDDTGQTTLEKRYTETVEIWFDGNKLRGDRTPSSSGKTIVSCFGCAGEGTHVYYDNTVSPQGGKTALSVTADHTINPPKDSVPDPRWLGVCPAPLRLTTFLDAEHILSSSRRHGTENLEDGRVRVCWENDEGGRYDVRLRHDPPGIEHIILTYEHDGQAYVETLTVNNKVYTIASKTFLYPERIQFQQTVDGDMRIEESVQVVSADFRAPDPTVFSLSRIPGLEPGTPVHWALPRDRPVPDAPLEWDGTDIVGVFSGRADQKGEILDNGRRSFIRLFIIAINVVSVAIFLFIWIARRMRSGKG